MRKAGLASDAVLRPAPSDREFFHWLGDPARPGNRRRLDGCTETQDCHWTTEMFVLANDRPPRSVAEAGHLPGPLRPGTCLDRCGGGRHRRAALSGPPLRTSPERPAPTRGWQTHRPFPGLRPRCPPHHPQFAGFLHQHLLYARSCAQHSPVHIKVYSSYNPRGRVLLPSHFTDGKLREVLICFSHRGSNPVHLIRGPGSSPILIAPGFPQHRQG